MVTSIPRVTSETLFLLRAGSRSLDPRSLLFDSWCFDNPDVLFRALTKKNSQTMYEAILVRMTYFIRWTRLWFRGCCTGLRVHTQMPVSCGQHRNCGSEMYLNNSYWILHNILSHYAIFHRECPLSFCIKARPHFDIPYFHYRNLSCHSTQDVKLPKSITTTTEPIAIFRPNSICILRRPPQSPLRSQRLPLTVLWLKCPLQAPPTTVASPTSALTARYANVQNAPAARTWFMSGRRSSVLHATWTTLPLFNRRRAVIDTYSTIETFIVLDTTANACHLQWSKDIN